MTWDKKYGRRALGIVLFTVLTAAMVLISVPARAEGLPKADSFLPLPTATASAPWSGIGVGVYGSWVNGHTDFGSGGPVYMGSEGSEIGGQLSVAVQAGVFVAEAFGEYGFVFGDLKDIGATGEYAVGGKAGVLVNPATLIYGLGAKSWIATDSDITNVGTIDGWQFGGGVAVKLPSAPLFVSLEYRRGLYEVEGVDIDTDTVRLGLTYKLGGK